MLISIKRYDKLVFIMLAGLVIAANFLLYRTSFLAPVPEGVYWGTAVDLFVVLPALAYFFLIRKKRSIIFLSPILLAAYGLSYLIIPDGLLHTSNLLRYILVLGEILILTSALLGNKQRLSHFYKEVKELNRQDSFLKYNFDQVSRKHFSDSAAIRLLASESALFQYGFFSWRRKPLAEKGKTFTYHKKKSTSAVYIMLIHATVLESVGLHFFLHQWNAAVSFILLFLNVYAVLFYCGAACVKTYSVSIDRRCAFASDRTFQKHGSRPSQYQKHFILRRSGKVYKTGTSHPL
jgi:hypothetical protein